MEERPTTALTGIRVGPMPQESLVRAAGGSRLAPGGEAGGLSPESSEFRVQSSEFSEVREAGPAVARYGVLMSTSIFCFSCIAGA